MITRHLVKIGIAVVVILLGSKVNYHTIASFLGRSFWLVYCYWLWCWCLVKNNLEPNVIFNWRGCSAYGGRRFANHSCMCTSKRKTELHKRLSKVFIYHVLGIYHMYLYWSRRFSTASLLMGICIILMFVGRISMIIEYNGLLSCFGGFLLITGSTIVRTALSSI